MKGAIPLFQLGKNGLTENFIETISKTFKKHDLVKISILRSCCRDKKELKKLSDEICQKLSNLYEKRFVSRILGYTVFIKKWRKKT
ncbi:MAG: YhbY family RNA-binding protein [archaeon]|nr:MAG: YhbY family RNA-binding protein [archaeon]